MNTPQGFLAAGQISIFRTEVWTPNGPIPHAFVIYKANPHELHIVDPMLKQLTLVNQEILSSCSGIPIYGNAIAQQLLDTYKIPYTIPSPDDLSDTQPYSFSDDDEAAIEDPKSETTYAPNLFTRAHTAPAVLQLTKTQIFKF